ncbi:hypothetical protein PA01_08590 [Azoarcus sp. PA01]|nr:hypothetical protein PA01_08590 [Azoarcus sp. PA01]
MATEPPDIPPVTTPGVAQGRAALPESPLPAEPPSVADAVARLADFARRAYRDNLERRLRTLLYPTDHTVLEALTETYQAAGLIGPLPRRQDPGEPTIRYATEVRLPFLAQVREAYLRDLAVVMPLVEEQAFYEAIRRLNAHEVLRINLEFDMLDPVALRDLHAAARAYLAKRRRALHGLVRETAGFTNEDFLAAERGVREAIDNEHLKLLVAHKDRDSLVPELAMSADRAEAAVRRVLAEAREAIFEFGDELDANRDHVWRYPPAVGGAAPRVLRLAGVNGDAARFAAYLENLADEKSFDPLQIAFFVAGVAVMAVGLAVFPGGGLIVVTLEGLDAGMAVYAAVRSYRQERETELANLATVLGQGAPFAPREASYGLVALEGWTALLTAMGFLGVLSRTAKSARAAAAPVVEADVATASRGLQAAPEGAQARPAIARQRAAETPAAAREARREARPRRGATRVIRPRVERRRAVGMNERGIDNPLGERTELELIESLEGQPGTLIDDPLPTRARARRMVPRDPAEVGQLAEDLLEQAGGDSARALATIRARHGDTELADDLAAAVMVRQPTFRGEGAALGGRESADFQRLVTGRDHEYVFDLPEPVGVTQAGRPRTETRIDGITASHLVDAKYTEADISLSAHVTRRRRAPDEVLEQFDVDRRIVEEARRRGVEPIDEERLADTLDQMTRQLMLAQHHGFLGVRWVCSTPDLATYFRRVYESSNLPRLFNVEFSAVVFEPGG